MLEYVFDERFAKWEKALREIFPELEGCEYIGSCRYSEWNTGGQTIEALWHNREEGTHYCTTNSDYGVFGASSCCHKVQEMHYTEWERV